VVRVPAEAGNFSHQTGSGAYPASYQWGTMCSFPEDKAVGAWRRPLTCI